MVKMLHFKLVALSVVVRRRARFLQIMRGFASHRDSRHDISGVDKSATVLKASKLASGIADVRRACTSQWLLQVIEEFYSQSAILKPFALGLRVCEAAQSSLWANLCVALCVHDRGAGMHAELEFLCKHSASQAKGRVQRPCCLDRADRGFASCSKRSRLSACVQPTCPGLQLALERHLRCASSHAGIS